MTDSDSWEEAVGGRGRPPSPYVPESHSKRYSRDPRRTPTPEDYHGDSTPNSRATPRGANSDYYNNYPCQFHLRLLLLFTTAITAFCFSVFFVYCCYIRFDYRIFHLTD